MKIVIRSGRVEVDEDGRVRAVSGPGDVIDVPEAVAAVMVGQGAAQPADDEARAALTDHADDEPSNPADKTSSKSRSTRKRSSNRGQTAAIDPGGETR